MGSDRIGVHRVTFMDLQAEEEMTLLDRIILLATGQGSNIFVNNFTKRWHEMGQRI